MVGKDERDGAEHEIRELMSKWEDGRSVISEYTDPHPEGLGRATLSDAEREVAVALNLVMELITREELRGPPWARQIVYNELLDRELPIVAPTKFPPDEPGPNRPS